MNSNETKADTQQVDQDLLETFKAYLITQKQVSPRTAKDYGYAVGKFLRIMGSSSPTNTQAIQYYRDLQIRGYVNSTVANTVFALNHYFSFLGKKIHLKPPRRHKRQPDYLTVEEAQALVKVVSSLRDRAIVMTLLYTGMRVSELCNLNVSDLRLDNGEIIVRDTKNYQDRRVIVSEKCVASLSEYLESMCVTDGEAVFVSRKGGRISRGRVYAMIKKYGQLAGIRKKVTPHVLRHTLATNMIAHGASVIEVKQQLGHKSMESTLRYVHLQVAHRKELYLQHCPQF